MREAGAHAERAHAPATTLLALARTIQQRRDAPPGNPSQTLALRKGLLLLTSSRYTSSYF